MDVALEGWISFAVGTKSYRLVKGSHSLFVTIAMVGNKTATEYPIIVQVVKNR
jgi:hypothetical protein